MRRSLPASGTRVTALQVAQETNRTRGEGKGTRDEGRGTGDEGRGARDEGRGADERRQRFETALGRGFFEQRRYQRALIHLDGWGWLRLTGAQQLSARYEPPSHSGGPAEGPWPDRAVFLSAPVEEMLSRLGRPRLLVALLAFRYPRSKNPVCSGVRSEGWFHRGELGDFGRVVLPDFQGQCGTRLFEVAEFLREREMQFVRDLRKWLGCHSEGEKGSFLEEFRAGF